jgi:hypothetical protein
VNVAPLCSCRLGITPLRRWESQRLDRRPDARRRPAVVTIMVSDGQTTVSVTITVIAGGNGNDWNEQGAIVEYLGRTRFVDAVGRVAVPDGVGSWCTLIRTVPQRCQLVASTPVASHVSSRP